MRAQTFRRLAATVAVAALGLAGCSSGGSSGSDGDSKTVKVALVGISSDASIKLAQDKGFFEKQGIKVETKVVSDPTAGIGAAQSGQFDFAYTPSIPALTAMTQGVDLKIVAPADGYSDDAMDKDPQKQDDTAVMLAKGSKVKRPKDLEGKKVSVPARKAQLEVTLADLVKEDGGDPDKIDWMVLDFPSAVQSLEQGRVDASTLVSPFPQKAEKSGATWFAAPSLEYFEKGAVGLYVAGPNTVKNKSDETQAFMAGIKEANKYASSHRDEANKAAAEVTGQDLEVIEDQPETFWPEEVRLEDIQRTNKKLADLDYIPKEAPLDQDSIVKEKK